MTTQFTSISNFKSMAIIYKIYICNKLQKNKIINRWLIISKNYLKYIYDVLFGNSLLLE